MTYQNHQEEEKATIEGLDKLLYAALEVLLHFFAIFTLI